MAGARRGTRTSRGIPTGHVVTIEETDLERCYGVWCVCGWREVAAFGREQAEQMADRHAHSVGAKAVYVL